MTIETVARNLQFILAPVVMVTSCAILLGALQGRYATINDRLRMMGRERLDLWHDGFSTDPFHVERLQEIDRQVPELLQRHKRIHDAILLIFCAILVFLCCMFLLAIATGANSSVVATAALFFFLAGAILMTCGVGIAAVEIRNSHLALHYEIDRIMNLK